MRSVTHVEYFYYASNLLRAHVPADVEAIRAEGALDSSPMRLWGFVPSLMRIVADEMDRTPDGFERDLAAWMPRRSAWAYRATDPHPAE